MVAVLNVYISFMLKSLLKLSSKLHEAIKGLFYFITKNINRKLR